MANEAYVRELKAAETRYETLMNRIGVVKQFLEDCKGSGVSAIEEKNGGCEISYGGRGGELKDPVEIKVTAADGKGITKIETFDSKPGKAKTYAFTVDGNPKPFTISLDAGEKGPEGDAGQYIKDANLKHTVSLVGASANATGLKASVTGVSVSASIYSLTIDVLKALFNVSNVGMAVFYTDFKVTESRNEINNDVLETNESEMSLEESDDKGTEVQLNPVEQSNNGVNSEQNKMEMEVPSPTSTKNDNNGMSEKSSG